MRIESMSFFFQMILSQSHEYASLFTGICRCPFSLQSAMECYESITIHAFGKGISMIHRTGTLP